MSSLVIFAAGLIASIWPLSAPVLHDTTYAHNVLPLQDFITETLRRSKTSYSTLQVAMYYLILLKEHLPKCDFTREQSRVPADRRVMQCGRRMFLSALMLASKFLQDRNYSTRAWGKITGLPTSDINVNELKFLEAVNWKLHVSKEKFERWSHTVIALSAPPIPGISLVPQPSLVETIGWSVVLDRLTPDCLDDFSQFRDGSALLKSPCFQPDPLGMLTPPASPPDSVASDQEDSSEGLEVKYDLSDIELAKGSNSAHPAPPPAPYQPNLPTPRSSSSLSQRSSSSCSSSCSSSPWRTARRAPRCRNSSAAMAMLKLCARPADRTLCPPPALRPCKRTDLSERPSLSRRSSISSLTSSLSSPESVRSDLSGFQGRSRSSSISSVASSVLAPVQGAHVPERWPRDEQLGSSPRLSGNPPHVDCSSTLRPEEYTAADALLRFYELHRDEVKTGAGNPGECGPMRTELAKRSKRSPHQLNPSANTTEKKKKKRTHSKTNIPDLVGMPGDDVQSLVRRDLMGSGDEVSDMVVPDVDPKTVLGRHCKRNRSTKDQSLTIDLTRILLKDKVRVNRAPLSEYYNPDVDTREAVARCLDGF